jgi:pimeloyl-ACP methyl ester carboxylesterase
MKIYVLSVVFTVGLMVPLLGQQSKFLFDFAGDSSVQEHLRDVNKKIKDTTRIFSAIPQSPEYLQETVTASQHFPYPVIFIHGLLGSADTWAGFYNYALSQGWSYGGQILFNLNSDNNLYYSNITNTSTSDIVDFNNNLPAADFYLVNFNCSTDGTPYGENYNTPTQSNQAAIFKQGIAVSKAVGHVMTATGKNKVILLGHSMGGLAARQYLQNPYLWQPDNEHHVAKVITSGTPHGGSNVSFPGISSLVGIDEGSDAVRDLRESYFYSGEQGVFLYGGLENAAIMNDRFAGFYNYDVNCNGITGNQVVGLNQKSISTDLDFACIIGDWTFDFLGGDLVVGLYEAQLKSYYSGLVSETFEIDAFHIEMPAYTKSNYEALDEPDYYDISYDIEKNQYYNGFITLQAPDAEYSTIDYDDYVFQTQQTGLVSVVVDNVFALPLGVSILGYPNLNYVFNQSFYSSSFQTQAIQLPAGTYYLEFYAVPTSSSWEYPYEFRVEWTPVTPSSVESIYSDINVKIAPNPTNGLVNMSVRTDLKTTGVIKVIDRLGKEVYRSSFEGLGIDEVLDLHLCPDGVYFIYVITESGFFSSKLLKSSN